MSDGEARREAALALALRGFFVLPIAINSKQPDSLLTSHGWQDSTRDPEEISAWFDVRSACNLAIACGPQFDILVIDIDVKNDAPGLETAHRLFPQMPATLTADTPSGGVHHYFRHPHVPLAATLPGVDIKGANGCGYVLAPPSTLELGAYRWRDPDAVPVSFPETLLVHCAPGSASSRCSGALATLPSNAEGGRHNQLVRLAVMYRDRGLDLDEVRALLWHRAEAHFHPPFARSSPADQDEIDRIVNWLPRRAWGER